MNIGSICRKASAVLCMTLLAVLCMAQQHVKWSIDDPAGKAGDKVTLTLHAAIDPGWHLYSIVPVKGDTGPVPTTITVTAPLALNGKVTEDKPISKLDPNFNLVVQFFENTATFHVPVTLGAKKDAPVSVRFQLCNDSLCIPPATVQVPIGGSSAVKPAPGPAAANSDAYTDKVNKAQQGGFGAFIGLSFVAGLLSLLTPCVFPMIPITVSYFSKRKGAAGSAVGISEAVAYCVGIVGTYAVVGLLVSVLFGASGIARFATNPYVNMAMAALFVVLALSLLGIYSINLPPALVNRFSASQGKGGLLAPMLMGLTFTLTSFTCTVPFVGTILAGASTSGYGYAFIGMLAYGTAFSLPFFLLALFPQYLARLPKSGAWLETVKAFMGFIEVAAALKFLSNADLVLRTNLISRPTFLGIWAALALVAGLFLLGVVPLPHLERPKKLGNTRLAFGVASVGLAAWFMFHIGGESLGEAEAFMPPTESGWLKDYNRALTVARQTNRPILINFTGVTCTNCRWMERNMFPQPTVKEALDGYVTVELYTDRETAGDVANQALQLKLTGVTTLPEYVKLAPDGTKLNTDPVFQGSTRSTDTFVSFLKHNSKSPLSASR